MRIFDENDNELREEDIDLEEGYLTPDRKFIRHHDAIEGHGRVYHYTVKAFYFEDGTNYAPDSENDPHIIVDDAQAGLFRYNDVEGSGKALRGIDLKEVEDSAAVPAQEAWDEYEDIQRYHLYTQEEKDAKEREEEAKRQKEELINTGLERIKELENNRALKAEVEAVDSRVETLEDNSATKGEVETISERVEGLNSNYVTLDSTVNDIDTSVQGLDINLQTTNTTVDDLVITMADLLGV